NVEKDRELVKAFFGRELRKRTTRTRLSLLNPNGHSDVKVEKYVFSLNPSQFNTGTRLVWGAINGWTAFKNPQVTFRAEELYVNVDSPGIAYLHTIQAANINAAIGGVTDA